MTRLLDLSADEIAEATTVLVQQADLAFSHMIWTQYQPAVTIQERTQSAELFDLIQFGVLYDDPHRRLVFPR